MSTITTRLAVAGDAETVTAISRSTFYDTFHLKNTEEDMQLFLQQYFTLPLIRQELEDTSNTCILAYNNESVVGYCSLRENKEPVELNGFPSIEIARLYVIANAIGTGVGKILMGRAIEIAKEKNKQIIWLGVWENNPRAISFYKQCGFEKFSEHEFVLGKDLQNDWLMKKVLYATNNTNYHG